MEDYIKRYSKTYKFATCYDYIKMIYQSVFAGGHMIKDEKSSLYYLNNELLNMENVNTFEPLYEYISDDYVKINLRPYKKLNLDTNYLNISFIKSSNENKGSLDLLIKRIKIFVDLIKNKTIPLNFEETIAIINKYQEDNYPIFHHSEIYRSSYHPNYRIIHVKYLTEDFKYLNLCSFINSINSKSLIAIEGKCCSGKTYFTNKLKNDFNNVTIINVDDFFLNKNDKLIQTEIGDYIDYKLLKNEVLKNKNKNELNYKVFDCNKNVYYYKKQTLSDIIICEGVYSFNQYISKYYNYLIYIKVDKKTQLERLKIRTSSINLYNLFINEWIPKEDIYYQTFSIFSNANIVI